MNEIWKKYYDFSDFYDEEGFGAGAGIFLSQLSGICEQKDRDGKMYDTSKQELYKFLYRTLGKYSISSDAYFCSSPESVSFNIEYPIFFGNEKWKSEIIHVLETFGGKNTEGWGGNSSDAAYGISKNGIIICVSIKDIDGDTYDLIQNINDFLVLKR